MKTVGVVGGVGPLAGVDFQSKIMSQTRVERDQDHLDVISVSFPGRIPDRTGFLLGDVEENPAGPLAEQIHLLERMGAEIAAIPCNTAHAPLIFDDVKASLRERRSSIRLLHMINEVMTVLTDRFSPETPVGVLATIGSYQTGLYENTLKKHGFRPVVPDESGKRRAHDIIYSPRHGVKVIGVNDVARANLDRAVDELRERGARVVILGCTELPLLVSRSVVDGGTPLIDPTLILARAAVKAAAPDRLLDQS